jgi:hypothetical protein
MFVCDSRKYNSVTVPDILCVPCVDCGVAAAVLCEARVRPILAMLERQNYFERSQANRMAKKVTRSSQLQKRHTLPAIWKHQDCPSSTLHWIMTAVTNQSWAIAARLSISGLILEGHIGRTYNCSSCVRTPLRLANFQSTLVSLTSP